MVDFLKTSVTDVIRPFADSDLLVERRWYRVPWGTPTLAFPTVFMSTRYEAFPYLARGAGPIWPTPVDYHKRRTPRGLTFDHVCGTAAEFAGQGLYNPDVNVHYDEDWIPDCCGRVEQPVRGGFMIGGSAGDHVRHVDPTSGGFELGGEVGDHVRHVDPTSGGFELGGAAGESREYVDPTAGGFELGGEVGDHVRHVDLTAGGFELGGEVGDVFTPSTPAPGANCSGAPLLDHATDYNWVAPANNTDEQWWRWDTPGGGFFLLSTTGIEGTNVVGDVYTGATCGSATLATTVTADNTFVFSGADVLWLKVTSPSSAGSAYTLRLD